MSDSVKQPIQTQQSDEQIATKVHWDQSQMRVDYANVINILSTREEFSLLFGINSMLNIAESKGFDVKLSNRIVLTPHAAKRLAALLTERLREFEARYGTLDIGL